MLTILQDANGKIISTVYKILAVTCVAAASRRGYAKHRLIKFKGVFSSVAITEKLRKEILHLKECEFKE